VEGFPFVYRDRVRFRDVDSMRHVNNSVYLTYLESARIAYIDELSGAGDPVADMSMILARVEIDFRSPALYGEQIEVGVRPGRLGTKSFELESPITANGRLVAESKAVIVGYDYDRQLTIPIPEQWRRKLAA
jgi:acyl-CoA thioester hydrolase